MMLGIPIAVKTTLKGPAMFSFLSMLAEVVLPRVKDFDGVHYVQSEKNGNIDFGFSGSAMSLFPQIEGSLVPRNITDCVCSQLRCFFNVTRIRRLHCDVSDNNRRCKTLTLRIWYPI